MNVSNRDVGFLKYYSKMKQRNCNMKKKNKTKKKKTTQKQKKKHLKSFLHFIPMTNF